jgi:uncharacterized protein YbjT (DUF2867 family)
MAEQLVLVTGATGYIAGGLIPRLLALGYRVRCLARSPNRLLARSWYPEVEVYQGDVMQPASLARALQGIHTAYYLIHNMASGPGYTAREQDGARNFAEAAGQAGLEHIIYLGGLADPLAEIAAHMRSRIETGETLRQGKVPVTEFRAGIIVGPGSISFEMIRFMTELMPVIFGPLWLRNRAQPIAVQNVIDYLLAALKYRDVSGRVYEIGGPDVMSFADLMVNYGRIRGLWRKEISVPGIPLWFMALGVELMTPVPASIARPLVASMRSHSQVHEDRALQAFPGVRLLGYQQAVELSLEALHPERLEPLWRASQRPVTIIKQEGFFIDHRRRKVNARPDKVFQVVADLGGQRGWLYADWLWKLRGWLDRLLGGPGLRGRGSPLPQEAPLSLSPCRYFAGTFPYVSLQGRSAVGGEDKEAGVKVGDFIDYYRVESFEEGHRLLLRAELKAPGQGWMEWRVEADQADASLLTQTGFFAPRGLPGFAYWYLLGPIHRLVFRGLINAIARQSLE